MRLWYVRLSIFYHIASTMKTMVISHWCLWWWWCWWWPYINFNLRNIILVSMGPMINPIFHSSVAGLQQTFQMCENRYKIIKKKTTNEVHMKKGTESALNHVPVCINTWGHIIVESDIILQVCTGTSIQPTGNPSIHPSPCSWQRDRDQITFPCTMHVHGNSTVCGHSSTPLLFQLNDFFAYVTDQCSAMRTDIVAADLINNWNVVIVGARGTRARLRFSLS